MKKRREQYHAESSPEEGDSKRLAVFEELTWNCLPLAKPLEPLDDRFLVQKIEGKKGVYLMGRKNFGALRKRVMQLVDEELPGDMSQLLVHGPRGTGKSHLLLALIACLTEDLSYQKRTERVAPLVDCGTFVMHPVKKLKAALAWAFWDDKREQDEIAALRTEEDIREYLDGKEKEIVILLDQVQALDVDPAAKSRLMSLVHGFRTVLVTSGGGEELTKLLRTSHKKAVIVPVAAGFTEVGPKYQ